MDGLDVALSKLPIWVGTAPMWGIFGLVLLGLIKIWPQLRQQSIDERLNIRDRYLARIEELKKEVKDCRDACDEQERSLREKIDALQTKLNNEAWQRIQSEISLVSTLINVVDAPQLKLVLAALERRKGVLSSEVQILGNITGDAAGGK